MILTPPYQGLLSRQLQINYTPPLDLVSGCDYAYSMRRLRTAYAGDCVRIRGDGPGTWPQNIGFVGSGSVNTAQIGSLAGSDTVWIDRWYDQSGAGRNIESNNFDTAGILVKDGVTQTRNGLMCPNFGLGKGASEPGAFIVSDLGRLEFGSVLTTGCTVVCVAEARTGDAYRNMMSFEVFSEDEISGNSYNAAPIIHTNDIAVNNGTPFANSTVSLTTKFTSGSGFKVWTSRINFSTKAVACFINSTANGTGTATNAGQVMFSRLTLGGRTNSGGSEFAFYGKVYVAELMIFDSVLSDADRATVVNNAIAYWGIT